MSQTREQINKDYTDVCVKLGDLVFRRSDLEAQAVALNNEIDGLYRRRHELAQAASAFAANKEPVGAASNDKTGTT